MLAMTSAEKLLGIPNQLLMTALPSRQASRHLILHRAALNWADPAS